MKKLAKNEKINTNNLQKMKLSYREAWAEIKRQIGSATYIRSDLGAPQITTMRVKDTGLFEIIDDALTRLQFQDKLDNSFIFFAGGREAGKSAITMSICNKLRALEIIKDKRVDTCWLRRAENLSRYNLGVGTNQALKKAQYDLLKEVLCLKNY